MKKKSEENLVMVQIPYGHILVPVLLYDDEEDDELVNIIGGKVYDPPLQKDIFMDITHIASYEPTDTNMVLVVMDNGYDYDVVLPIDKFCSAIINAQTQMQIPLNQN